MGPNFISQHDKTHAHLLPSLIEHHEVTPLQDELLGAPPLCTPEECSCIFVTKLSTLKTHSLVLRNRILPTEPTYGRQA